MDINKTKSKPSDTKYIFKMTENMIDLFLNQLSAEDRNLMIGEENE